MWLASGLLRGIFGAPTGPCAHALYGTWQGNPPQPMLIGAFALAFFNLHDAVFLTFFGGELVGIIAGLVIGGLATALMIAARKN